LRGEEGDRGTERERDRQSDSQIRGDQPRQMETKTDKDIGKKTETT
jgi:hypothetical protein